MKAEEKRGLIAGRLAIILRELLPQVGELSHGIATSVTDQLWDTIAPMVDSLVIRDAIEQRLERYEGMPLSRSLVDEVMTEIDRTLDSLSSGVEKAVVRGARHNRSVGVWGGRVGGDAE
jgi:hypothetical protein